MRTLVLDTSTNLLYVCFIEDNKVLYEVKTIGQNNHSDHLLSSITEGLNKLNWQVKDFDRIILGEGPGAYTGLRVSMTVAKMFAWTLNIPLYTISSLDLLTSGYNDDGTYVVKFKAKKGFVYYKAFTLKDEIKTNLEEEKFINDDYLPYNDKSIKVITNDLVQINPLNIKENEIKLVTNIHNLEPNYLRDC